MDLVMKKLALIVALMATLFVVPTNTQAHGFDDLWSFVGSTGWSGDVNSPLVDLFVSAEFGDGRAGLFAVINHLGRECGFVVPEPTTALLTGLFLSLGYAGGRRKKELNPA